MSFPTLTGLTFERRMASNTDAVEFVFRPNRPGCFDAGQHGLWYVPGGGVKPMTIASAPGSDVISMATTLASGSRFKRALADLAAGDRAWLVGPLGSFATDPAAAEVVMVAQGIGVTPFLSMLREGTTGVSTTSATTLVQVGTPHYRAETAPATTDAFYCRSRSDFADALGEVLARRPEAQYLVSGTPKFVGETTSTVRAAGVAGAQIGADKFWGMGIPDSTPAADTATRTAA